MEKEPKIKDRNKAGVKTTKKPSAKEITVNETKTTKENKLELKDLVNAFKGTLVTDTDKTGYTNFRYPGSKKIQFFAIDRKYGIALSTRDNTKVNGWGTRRITNDTELKSFVQSIKAGEQ